MNRTPGRAVPQQRRLALIGDADGDNVARGGARLPQRVAASSDGRLPQILRIVLDLAVGGEMLREFALRNGGNRRIGAKQHRPRRCRALIDRQDVG